MEWLFKFGVVLFDLDCLLDELVELGFFCIGVFVNILCWEDVEEDDDVDEGGLGWSIGVMINFMLWVML